MSIVLASTRSGVFSALLRAVFVLAAAALLVQCANPVPPSGGPRDTTPPSVATSRPVSDTVNVGTETQSIRITFSEYVERSTLPGAVAITPSPEGRLRFDWSGRTVSIELPTTLRDSTTYIVSLGTDLTDAHGVSLEEPITLAFSTGPRINQGELAGRVVTPRQGDAQGGVDVFAYATPDTAERRAPDPLPEQPAYRTQTGEEGSFSFDYLREQRYYVLAVRDNNRNRRPDPGEAVAAPPHPALPADSSAAEVPVPWLLTRIDTTGPSLQQANALSRQRLQLSFDEPVRLGTRRSEAWTLRDSTTSARVPVTAVYAAPDRANVIVLRTEAMDSTRHRVSLGADLVTDTLGQDIRPDTARFRAAPMADTVQTRFRTFVPAEASPDTADLYPLLPEQAPGVRFNQAPDSAELRERLFVGDTMGTARPYTLNSDDGRTYRVQTDPPLEPGEVLEVAVAAGPESPDTTYHRRFYRVSPRRLGAVEGRALRTDTTLRVTGLERSSGRTGRDTTSATADSASGILVELRPGETALPVAPRRQTVAAGSTFVFRRLPEGDYQFRAVLDRNANERWDGGQIQPYVPPEPLTWSSEPTEARPRWTTVLPAPLRVPLLRLAPPDTTAADPNAEVPADTTAPTDTTSTGRP